MLLEDDSDEAEDEVEERPLNPEELKIRAENQYKIAPRPNSKPNQKMKQKMRR